MGKDVINANVFEEKKHKKGVMVTLLNQKNNSAIASKVTNKDGAVKFKGLDLINNVFMIIAHDNDKKHNGVIADNIGGQNVDN
ncbi:MAG: hypothetical protein ACRCXK_02000 [Wohlfahrtiimonas sp.]